MITIKDFLEAINYDIGDADRYNWDCYGITAHCYTNAVSNIVFDTVTKDVYEVSVFDDSTNTAYRIINPAFKDAYHSERKTRGIDDYAYDNVPYTDLEVDSDFLNKLRGIVNNEEYSKDIVVPINLTDDELFTLFKMAHEEDITLNQLVNKLLMKFIESSSDNA